MAVYGNAIDSVLTPGAQLYVPGQTKLAKGDVWLGGVSTLADDQLNGATRVSGANRQATADAYTNYQTGQAKSAELQSQLDASNAQLKSQADTKANMEALKQAQLQASIAGLDKSKNASLSNLSAEKATIEPQYQKQKMQAGVTAKQTARSFDEYMAQRGGGIAGNNKSGIAGQGTLMNNLGYQGQVGALNQAEAGAITDNARRVTGVQNAYESDVQSAQAGIQAQHLQNYINQMNQDRQFEQSQSQFDQNFGLQRDQYQSGLSQWDKSFGLQQSQYSDNKTQQQWENEMAQLSLARQKANSGGSSSGNGGPANANATTIKYGKDLVEALQMGATIPQINTIIAQLEKTDPRINGDWLRTQANSFPIDNWQYKPGY